MTKSQAVDDGYIAIEPEFFTLDELVERFLWKEANIEDYKNIAWRISGAKTVFSSWLYTKRKKLRRGGAGYYYSVKSASFDRQRILLVNAVLEFLYCQNVKDTTKSGQVRNMETFIEWLNISDTEVTSDIREGKRIFREYTKYLQEIVNVHDPRRNKVGSFGGSPANLRQHLALEVLSIICKTEKSSIQGMTLIIPQSFRRKGPPDIDFDQQKIDQSLSYCFQFFEQVAEFCLKFMPYPHKINILDQEVLLIPAIASGMPVITPFTIKSAKGKSLADIGI